MDYIPIISSTFLNNYFAWFKPPLKLLEQSPIVQDKYHILRELLAAAQLRLYHAWRLSHDCGDSENESRVQNSWDITGLYGEYVGILIMTVIILSPWMGSSKVI